MTTSIPLTPQGPADPHVASTEHGVTVGGWWPVPDVFPDYPDAGEQRPFGIDVAGNLAVRGPIVTDEGGWREDFPGAALSADWESSVGAGGSIAVASSVLTISAGSTPNERTFVSRFIDFLPLVVSVHLVLSTRNTPGGGRDFFMGLYYADPANAALDPDHASVQTLVEWRCTQAQANTDTDFILRGHLGAGGQETVANQAVTSTTTAGFRSYSLDAESVIFRDGAVSLPAPIVRQTRSLHLPGPYDELFFSCGYRNGGSLSGGAQSAQIDVVIAKNLNRLVVNTGF